MLEDRGADRIINTAAEILAAAKIPSYDEDTKKGTLRHIQVRRAHMTGEALVTVVTGHDQFPYGREFAASLMRRCPDVKGVIQNINDRNDSAVLGFRERLLGGKDEIRDEMCGVKVFLKYRSFYQVNTPQAEILYRTAVDAANLTRDDNVLDAYCGVGLIGMLAAEKAGSVTGIEIVEPAVQCAKKAALQNGKNNIRFLCGDAAKALTEGTVHYQAVFADPPRAGLSSVFLKSLLHAEPEKIIYISCEPNTLYRDLNELVHAGFRSELVQPVDMFLYTEHVETVILLSQQKPDTTIRVGIDLKPEDVTAAESKATYADLKAYIEEKYGFKVSNLYIAQAKETLNNISDILKSIG